MTGPTAVAFACLLLLPAMAGAAPRVGLSYEVGSGAEQCEEARTLRQNVALRLGYDAFDGSPTEWLRVRVAREGPRLTALIELFGLDGESLGERRLASHSADCAELAAAIELAVSIAIDPLSQASRPVAAPAPAPRIEAPPVPAPAPPPRLWPRFEVAVGAVGVVGAAPATTAGFTAELSARWRHYALGVEGRADLPAAAHIGGTPVQSSLLLGTLLPCYRGGIFGGCLLFSAGLEESTGAARPSTLQTLVGPYFAVGLRALVDWPLSSLFTLRFHVDGLVSITNDAVFGDASAWSAPALAAAAGAAAVFRLP